MGITKLKMKKDIYVIRNRINNKVYVGQSIDAGRRFITHCKPSSNDGHSLIARAIQKYGAHNFWYDILEHQVYDYNEKERYWISELNSLAPNGYNVLHGGDEPPVHFATEHPLSSFMDATQVTLLKQDLKTSAMSLSEIARKYGISKRTVLRVNQGLHYEVLGEEYPIRRIPNKNGKLSDEQVEEIVEILQHTYRQYADIAKQYDISISAVKQINSGDCHPLSCISYPIRSYKNSGTPACTYDQVTEIGDLLMNTDISCGQLAKIFNVDLQTIYIINNGNAKRYRRDELNYPLRKRCAS